MPNTTAPSLAVTGLDVPTEWCRRDLNPKDHASVS